MQSMEEFQSSMVVLGAACSGCPELYTHLGPLLVTAASLVNSTPDAGAQNCHLGLNSPNPPYLFFLSQRIVFALLCLFCHVGFLITLY